MLVRAEHLEQPFGFVDRRPRLSWQLPESATRQHADELRLDDGTTTGRVESAENVLVAAWPGEPLSSRERREVQVRVWTDVVTTAPEPTNGSSSPTSRRGGISTLVRSRMGLCSGDAR
jgi:hypothetical protein